MSANNKPLISIGASDFKELLQAEALYVDKSQFICDVLNDGSVALLITRPRRFGKTLNLSMLQYFFDIRNSEENRELFWGLDVYKNEKVMAQQGTRPVIFLSFKDCKGDSWAETKSLIDGLLSSMVKNIMPLIVRENIDQIDADVVLRLRQKKASLDESIRSITLLTELLVQSAQLPPALILIDEYDVPLQNAWLRGFWDQAVSFMSRFFCAAFKDNPHIWKVVMTGCLRISKESIFTDLNNISVYAAHNYEYSVYFGFTESEVNKLLRQYGLTEYLAGVKKWYDGYNFGGEIIYNPWSILNWLKRTGHEFCSYWANTSGNELVRSILFRADEYVKQQLLQLLNGESIGINHREHLVFREIESSSDTIWSFLFSTGYLKSVESLHKDGKLYLTIPNREVRGIFENSIKNWFAESRSDRLIDYIGRSLKQGNGEEFAEHFKNMIERSFSYFDLGEGLSENFYHAFSLGLMVHLSDYWQIKSNREAGYGRSDILLFPKYPAEYFGVVMEFKVSKTVENLSSEAKDALAQIEKQAYAKELQNAGAEKVLKLGIAFCKKQVEILTLEASLLDRVKLKNRINLHDD